MPPLSLWHWSLSVIIMSRLVSLPCPLVYTSSSTPYFCHPRSSTFPNSELSVLTPFFSHPTSNQLWNPVCLASAVPPKSDPLLSVIYFTLGTTDVLGWMILCCGDCPEHCSIPGLAPVDAMTFPSCDNQICLLTLPNVSYRAQLLRLRASAWDRCHSFWMTPVPHSVCPLSLLSCSAKN